MHHIDIFGQNPTFLFQGKSKISSKVTIAVSVGFYFTMILLAIFFGKDFYYKEEPFLSNSFFHDNNPSEVKLTSEFVYAVGLQKPKEFTSFIDPEVYTISARQETRYFFKDKPAETKVQNLTVVPCNQIKSDLFDSLDGFDREHHYCINSSDLSLKGEWNTPEFTYIVMDIMKCDPEASKCKPDAEFQSAVNGGNIAGLITDTNFNPKSFDKPTPKFFKNYFTSVNSNSQPWMTYYYSPVEVNSDIGLFFSQIESLRDMVLDRVVLDLRPADGKKLGRVAFRLSTKTLQYNRIYIKVQKVLADIGGVSKTIQLLGFLLCYLNVELNKFLAIISILGKPVSSKIKMSSIELSQQSLRIRPFIRQQYRIAKDNPEQVEKIKCNWKMFCCTKRIKHYNKLYKVHNFEIRKYMDIQFLIKSIKELEILKKLLLTEEQNKLVNFFNSFSSNCEFSDESYKTNSDFDKLSNKHRNELQNSISKIKSSNEVNDRALYELLFEEIE